MVLDGTGGVQGPNKLCEHRQAWTKALVRPTGICPSTPRRLSALCGHVRVTDDIIASPDYTIQLPYTLATASFLPTRRQRRPSG